MFKHSYWVIEFDFAMNQRPYRLRSSSAGPRLSGPAETERLAQVVMLDHHKESMPGREVRMSTHDVAAETEMRVEVASSDTPWGLSSSPHFNTINNKSLQVFHMYWSFGRRARHIYSSM